MAFTELCNEIFSRAINDYHQADDVDTKVNNPYGEGTIENSLYMKCWIDTVQWHLEDIIRDPQIDSIILGCTHYPLLLNKILKYTPRGVKIVPQGEYVSNSLKDYFVRHPDIEAKCTKNGLCHYLTTENTDKFRESAQLFLHERVDVENITLG